MKTCFKCQRELPLSAFYKHKQMADGHLNKCKDCARKDVLAHRILNIEKIRAYDRRRGSRQSPGYSKEYRKLFPKKYKAHTLINNAIRDGRLKREPCEECGEDYACAHHDDYSYPLSVRWLCYPCHSQWHAKNGEGKNP